MSKSSIPSSPNSPGIPPVSSPSDAAGTDVLEAFHPAVSGWFRQCHGSPTDPQREGWPAIRSGRHTLIAAPTGSGKTLAAFLSAIDSLVRQSLTAGLPTELRVLYISPLKALSADIRKNLAEPLEGIAAVLRNSGLPQAGIRTALRTGDTPASERAAMIKNPPHILVTTPESFFILLTSQRGREMLSTVRTVIVDEIHALAGNKRGSHLVLSLERLEALTAQAAGSGHEPLARIGLSATQKPIEEIARFLTGAGGAQRMLGDCEDGPACIIVDTGHVRERDLAIEVPSSPLEAVMSGEVWTEVYQRLTALAEAHRTTLVFVNTRRMAERVARHLSERLGEENVCAHHGSMARELRHVAEQRLKEGKLQVLVATASLELGIDIGAIDLVCQLGSTRSITAFLQRVGRSGHTLQGTPKGRLFPLTRDELVECAALLDAVQRGELDRLLVPPKPLDILAQQIVAAVACEEWESAALFALFRRAWPYRELERREFDDVVEMLARGFKTGRGRHGAYLHHDAVNGRLRGRKGARHAAIVSGGAIPELAIYDVVQEPGELRVGNVDEDFAIESLPGDIFQLGNTSWRILRVESGIVRVEDAHGQPPTLPFWVGEAPGRTDELSLAVSRLRVAVAEKLGPLSPAAEDTPAARPASMTGAGDNGSSRDNGVTGGKLDDEPAAPRLRFVREDDPAVRWLVESVGVVEAGALQIVEYLAAARAALGAMPSQQTVVLERFFDESGAMQLVIHSPFGSRLNKAWGLALRKRFCRSFNFELQAAAIEDAIVLSLGPTHSFPLESVYRYLNSGTVRGVLIQALLGAPVFPVRWRHNTNRSLAVLRRYGDRKVPPHLQRIRADDMLALVFPDSQACLENIVGDREVPDHPLIAQTLRDCMEEVMDIEGLERLLRAMEAGEVEMLARDLREPSPLAAEILNARPYAFLDDAPLEERRTRAVQSRRWLDPETAGDLADLDANAIAMVRAEAWPAASNADELHDTLMLLGLITEGEGKAGSSPLEEEAAPEGEEASPPHIGWAPLLAGLIREGRATVIELDDTVEDGAVEDSTVEGCAVEHAGKGDGKARFWAAAEWLPQLRTLYPELICEPAIEAPATLWEREWTRSEALTELLRARMEACGPITPAALAEILRLPLDDVDMGLLNLESEGFAFRGRFTPGLKQEEWCERGLLARIHRYTLNRLRREIEPVSSADFLRFLLVWQRVQPSENAEGVEGLAGVIDLLEGFEAPAAAWEAELLASRMGSYDKEWLDRLCSMGRVAWTRLSPPAGGGYAYGGGNGNGKGNRKGKDEGTHDGNGDGSGHSQKDSRPVRRGGPVASTPLALLNRSNLGLWRGLNPQPDPGGLALSAQARAVVEILREQGASFFSDIAEGAGLLPTHTEAALGELVACGLVTADSFAGLRSLLRPSRQKRSHSVGRGLGRNRGRGGYGGIPAPFSPQSAGRWGLVRVGRIQRGRSDGAADAPESGESRKSQGSPAKTHSAMPGSPSPAKMSPELLEAYAWVLLRRYGVVFRRMQEREGKGPPWRDLLRVYRRLEARGEIRGGRFVSGMAGEQYALPEAVGKMREVRRQPRTGMLISVSGADPLNLVGILTPGKRVTAVTANRVLFMDGEPVAVREGGHNRFLREVPAGELWVLQNALEGRLLGNHAGWKPAQAVQGKGVPFLVDAEGANSS